MPRLDTEPPTQCLSRFLLTENLRNLKKIKIFFDLHHFGI